MVLVQYHFIQPRLSSCDKYLLTYFSMTTLSKLREAPLNEKKIPQNYFFGTGEYRSSVNRISTRAGQSMPRTAVLEYAHIITTLPPPDLKT